MDSNVMSVQPIFKARALVMLFALAILASFTGCVERRYTIRTNPPGALAYVNGEEIGTTPVSRSFTYYGDRYVTLVADGYQTERFVQPIPSPRWDNMFTEFFVENLWPKHLRDEREFMYDLRQPTPPPQNDILNRGEMLRSKGQSPPAPLSGGVPAYFGAQ